MPQTVQAGSVELAAEGRGRYRLMSTKTPAMSADAPSVSHDCIRFQPFACLFTRPTWKHAQVLLIGTLLAQGHPITQNFKCTIASCFSEICWSTRWAWRRRN